MKESERIAGDIEACVNAATRLQASRDAFTLISADFSALSAAVLEIARQIALTRENEEFRKYGEK